MVICASPSAEKDEDGTDWPRFSSSRRCDGQRQRRCCRVSCPCGCGGRCEHTIPRVFDFFCHLLPQWMQVLPASMCKPTEHVGPPVLKGGDTFWWKFPNLNIVLSMPWSFIFRHCGSLNFMILNNRRAICFVREEQFVRLNRCWRTILLTIAQSDPCDKKHSVARREVVLQITSPSWHL